MKIYRTILASLMIAGCASQGAKPLTKTDDSKKADFYLQGYSVGPVSAASDTCSSSKSESWKVLVSKAAACARSGQWSQVEEIAYQMSKADVESPWGLYFYSLAAEAKKDFPRALWMIDAAIKKSSPKTAIFRYQKGRIMWADKPSESALKEIEASVKLDSNLVDANVFLGDARLRSGELSVAENYFQSALKVQSNYFEAVRGMAEVKRLKGNYSAAIPFFEQATSLKPTDLTSRVYLATAYEEEKKPSEALATYRALKESLSSGLVKEKPDFDVNEKIHSLESVVAANEAKLKQQAVPRNPAQKGDKK